jgi:AraC-like DNA-binding protein
MVAAVVGGFAKPALSCTSRRGLVETIHILQIDRRFTQHRERFVEYREIATDDIDRLFAWGSGWVEGFTQLSPGPLGFRCRQVELPGVSILWNSFDQSILAREVLVEPALFFALVLEGTGPVTVRGLDMASNDGFVYQCGVEQEYRVPRETLSLIVSVGPPLFRRLGWNLSQHAIRRVPRPLLSQLVAVCEDATAAAVMQGVSDVAVNVELLRDRVVVALRNALEPWMLDGQPTDIPSVTASREFLLVKRAEQIMRTLDVDQRLSVRALAAELGTSERLLYESFRKWLGIGPYEFHMRRKLHQFRKILSTGKPYHGKIMQSARLAGFHHMGRATQSFRLLFGETPRAMMKRRSLLRR